MWEIFSVPARAEHAAENAFPGIGPTAGGDCRIDFVLDVIADAEGDFDFRTQIVVSPFIGKRMGIGEIICEFGHAGHHQIVGGARCPLGIKMGRSEVVKFFHGLNIGVTVTLVSTAVILKVFLFRREVIKVAGNTKSVIGKNRVGAGRINGIPGVLEFD